MRSIWTAVLLLVLGLTAAGCSKSEDPVQARAEQVQSSKGEIVVGVSWPFESRDDMFSEGLDLALEEINGSAADGAKFKLLKQDDKSSVTTGMSVAQSFANDLSMTAVIGHRGSSVSIPASQIYGHAGLLMLVPGSTAPRLTQSGNPLVIRMIPSDEQLGNQMASYIYTKSYRKIAIFYMDDEYGRGLANAFESSAAKLGIDVVDRVSSYKDKNDLKQIVEKWKVLGSDAAFIAGAMPEGAELIAGLREAGLRVPIFGGDGLDSNDLPKVAGSAAEGVVVGSIFNPYEKRPEVQKFVDAFKAKYNHEPNKWAAQGYDTLKLLADAIKQAGSRSPEAIAKAIKGMPSWQGVTGMHRFDANGDVQEKPIVRKIVRSGAFEYLQ